MKLLYSDILPLGLEEDQTTIADCFGDLISECDSVDNSSGEKSLPSPRSNLLSLESVTPQRSCTSLRLRCSLFRNSFK